MISNTLRFAQFVWLSIDGSSIYMYIALHLHFAFHPLGSTGLRMLFTYAVKPWRKIVIENSEESYNNNNHFYFTWNTPTNFLVLLQEAQSRCAIDSVIPLSVFMGLLRRDWASVPVWFPTLNKYHLPFILEKIGKPDRGSNPQPVDL